MGMLQQIEQLEKLLDKVMERLRSLEKEREGYGAAQEEQKKLVQEKELELIRLRKEVQRFNEQKERDDMQTRKDRAQAEQKLNELLERFRSFGGGHPGGPQAHS